MNPDHKPAPVYLWPELSSPKSAGEASLDEKGWYSDVKNPLIQPFLPDENTANGTGILICPGGSYRILDWVSHVERLANLFTPLGFAVLGLKYRVSEKIDSSVNALADIHRAIELIDEHAEEWNVVPKRLIGLGYSAGSNLLLRHACEEPMPEPSFKTALRRLPHVALLCCWPHHREPESYKIHTETSGVFICTTDEDEVAPTSFSQSIAERMTEAGIDVRISSYPHGGHMAFNFMKDGPNVDWTPAFLTWLRDKGLSSPAE